MSTDLTVDEIIEEMFAEMGASSDRALRSHAEAKGPEQERTAFVECIEAMAKEMVMLMKVNNDRKDRAEG